MRVLFATAEPPLRKLCLLSIWLECALCIEAGTVNVHLSLIPSDCILVEAFKLRGAFAATITAATDLFQDLRAVAHDLRRLSVDLGLEVMLFGLLVRLESALEVEDLVPAPPIVDQELLRRRVSCLLHSVPRIICLRVKRMLVKFRAQLLTSRLPEQVFLFFALFQTATIKTLPVVRPTWHRC